MDWLQAVPYPALALFAAGALAALGAARFGPEAWRAFCANLAFLSLVGALLEFACSDLNRLPELWRASSWAAHRGTYTEAYFDHDPVLGYGPARPGAFTSTKIGDDGVTVYSVRYTLDEHGARRTPAARGDEAVVFFGDSFTFGEDAEAFPAVFQRQLGDEVKALNLAFHGYGPHQMLRRLETGRGLAALAGRKVRGAFYLLLPDHSDRAAGHTTWDLEGPRYDWDGAGRVAFTGPFHTRHQVERWESLERVSATSRWFGARWPGVARNLPWSRERRERLLLDVLARSRELLRARYGTRLDLLTWWPRDEGLSAMVPRLRQRGFEVVTMQEVLPGFDRHELGYTIPGDAHEFRGHPNVRAHRLIGEFLARRHRDAPPRAD